ncbi:hypothetical protein WJX74_009009 [Apatococcus lobatus]|uniref:Uncharacterized protein n=1 Tax=Apatococcus lobatus TaxID=904363 RepID=A0AAW1Q394_9CHLO
MPLVRLQRYQKSNKGTDLYLFRRQDTAVCRQLESGQAIKKAGAKGKLVVFTDVKGAKSKNASALTLLHGVEKPVIKLCQGHTVACELMRDMLQSMLNLVEKEPLLQASLHR